jgi:hypothetical protein
MSRLLIHFLCLFSFCYTNTQESSIDFEINRRDYDVGGGSFILGKTVKINVKHYQDY